MHFLELLGREEGEATTKLRIPPSFQDFDVVTSHHGHVLTGEGVLRAAQALDGATVARCENAAVSPRPFALAEDLRGLVGDDPASSCDLPCAFVILHVVQTFDWQELVQGADAYGHVHPGHLRDAMFGELLGVASIPAFPWRQEGFVVKIVDRLDTGLLHVALAVLPALWRHDVDALRPCLDDHHVDVGQVELDLGGPLDADEARPHDGDGGLILLNLLQRLELPLEVGAAAAEEALVEAAPPSAAVHRVLEEGRVPQTLRGR
mmetsp:Transcript_25171/g.78404  ORF Transcript_25171/g.78404 Transcript_25171/m.78404 type:complete len:263 (-) Transcript_25171:532-1320(-)